MYSIFSFAKKNSKLCVSQVVIKSIANNNYPRYNSSFPEYPVFFVRLVMNAVLLHNSINMSDENKVLRKKLNSVIIAVADKLALEQNKLNEYIYNITELQLYRIYFSRSIIYSILF